MTPAMRLILPELWLCAMAAMFLIDASALKRSPQRTFGLALVSSAILFVISLCSLSCQGLLFHGVYQIDLFSQVFKLVLATGLLLVVFLSRDMKDLETGFSAEYFLFLACSTVGMMMLTSAMEMVTLYVSLELAAFSLYVLVPLRKGDQMDTEAAIKYLLFGVAASAVTLYGISLLFGFAETTYLNEIIPMMPQLMAHPMIWVSLTLILASFLFKLSVFPFHFWAPDVYEGANSQIVTFIATVSKAAAVAVMIRFFALSDGLSLPLNQLFIAVAIATMFLGNLAAIAQKDMKRMLAYSSIAQAGYILVGILTVTEDGLGAALFYAAVYVIMNFAAFLAVVKISAHGENPSIENFAGLSKRSPLLALTFMLALFSLAGLPPFAGFAAKWFVFKAAMEQGYVTLVLLGVLNSTISLYYYLMVVKQAYMHEPAANAAPIPLSLPMRTLSFCLIILIVALGVYPGALLDLSRAAVFPLLAIH